MSETMTQAQDDALDRAWKILHEHFEASVIVVQATHKDDQKKGVTRTWWSGGYSTAIGLMEVAKMKLLSEEVVALIDRNKDGE